jgi:RNA polymerase sigma factor for flagellar operon FliA
MQRLLISLTKHQRINNVAVESIFLENRSAIGKIAEFISRKHGLTGADAEDFASVVNLRLIENDYAVLRKFRGESSLNTFLAVVIAGIFRDFQVSRFGKWRPSAVAQSLGPFAIRLETLIFRDHYSTTEAVERVRKMPHCNLSEKELRKLAGMLPVKTRVRVGRMDMESSISDADDVAAAEDDYATNVDRDRIEAALNDVLTTLDPEDLAIVKMKFWSGISVADVSRMLCTPQKQLYRRLDKLAKAIKNNMLARGIREADIRDLLAE